MKQALVASNTSVILQSASRNNTSFLRLLRFAKRVEPIATPGASFNALRCLIMALSLTTILRRIGRLALVGLVVVGLVLEGADLRRFHVLVGRLLSWCCGGEPLGRCQWRLRHRGTRYGGSRARVARVNIHTTVLEVENLWACKILRSMGDVGVCLQNEWKRIRR